MMKKQTILVVDDDREIVRAISKLLELEGYETLKAYDGMEAGYADGSHRTFNSHGCDDAEDEWPFCSHEDPGN